MINLQGIFGANDFECLCSLQHASTPLLCNRRSKRARLVARAHHASCPRRISTSFTSTFRRRNLASNIIRLSVPSSHLASTNMSICLFTPLIDPTRDAFGVTETSISAASISKHAATCSYIRQSVAPVISIALRSLDLPRFRGEARCWVSAGGRSGLRPPCRCSSLVRPQRSPFLHPGPCAGSAVARNLCQARAFRAPARACA